MTAAIPLETPLETLLAEVRACRLCASTLPLGPRPVLQVREQARLLIVGQAPGTRVHESGIPFDDPSGERLRTWLGLQRETFYDDTRIAIIPVGLCYPGRDKAGGDKRPQPECAPLWQPRLRALLPNIRLTVLVGGYAQIYYLADRRKPSMTETVRAWREYFPEFLPTPHPSWRNTAWLQRNPWFTRDLVPVLRQAVATAIRS